MRSPHPVRTRLLSAVQNLGVLLVVTALLGGCTSSTGAAPKELEGTWVLESFGGASRLSPADPTVNTTITFKDGQASGSGGVNSFGGSYEASKGKIKFGAIASTEMAGPPKAMDQEARFFKALGDARVFEFNEGKLVLGDLGNNTLVVLVKK